MAFKNFIIASFTLLFLSSYAQDGKKIIKVTDYKDGRPLDTVVSYYNSKNYLIRIDNSYGYTFNYYNDSLVEKTSTLKREVGLKGCIDTMQSVYSYNKNNQLVLELIQTNQCPQQPGGTDGHYVY